MLELAAIRSTDVVADLGCGDGRIVIEAVRRGAARALCVDIDPASSKRAPTRAAPASPSASPSSTRTCSAPICAA